MPEVEVYVFGSAVENKITGASVIDLLVTISETETYMALSKVLEGKIR